MAKRRIVLSSQEMNDLTGKIKQLESQLGRSNHRVSELESGVKKIQKLLTSKTKRKQPEKLFDEVEQLSAKTINPPVKVKQERLAAELAEAAQEEAIAG